MSIIARNKCVICLKDKFVDVFNKNESIFFTSTEKFEQTEILILFT